MSDENDSQTKKTFSDFSSFQWSALLSSGMKKLVIRLEKHVRKEGKFFYG